MTAIRCPAPRVRRHTSERSNAPGGWLRPGLESSVSAAQTSRCTVGRVGAGKAGSGSHLSSMPGGETACADGVPNAANIVSADTASTRPTCEFLT